MDNCAVKSRTSYIEIGQDGLLEKNRRGQSVTRAIVHVRSELLSHFLRRTATVRNACCNFVESSSRPVVQSSNHGVVEFSSSPSGHRIAKLEENEPTERKEAEGPSVFSKRFADASDDRLPIRFCNRPLRRTGNYCKYGRAPARCLQLILVIS